MTISTLHPDDIAQLSALQPPDWPDILPHVKFYISSPACFPVKAMAGDSITGIGASLLHGDTAWLAHIIVHPDHRKKGIGQLITQTLVDDLRAKGLETVYLIATDLGAPVYTKVGFETETEYIAFKGSARAGAAISGNIVPFNSAFREPLLQLDQQVTGEDRGYRLEEHLSGGYVHQANGRLQGYFLPDFGEGLIVADNPAAGVELMKLRLRQKDGAMLPQENEAGIRFLLESNLEEFKRARRMRLGKKRMLHLHKLYNRISGQIG